MELCNVARVLKSVITYVITLCAFVFVFVFAKLTALQLGLVP